MSSIKVREDGYVISLNRTQLEELFEKNPQAAVAVQYLEDGLSYLNYSKVGSTRGTKDPEMDYKTGIDFIKSALNVLRSDIEM